MGRNCEKWGRRSFQCDGEPLRVDRKLKAPGSGSFYAGLVDT